MPEQDPQAALERLERLVAEIEELPDGPEKERTTELLDAVDAAHRALVWYVGERLYTENAPLFERLLKEPIASLLFEMYGLVSPDRASAKEAVAEHRPAAVVGLDALLSTIPPPRKWFDAVPAEAVAEGALVGTDVVGERVLLVRAGGEVRAYADACPGTPLPLSVGRIRGGVLSCSWHDCRFDARTGERLDASGPALEALPVEIRGDEVRVAVRARQGAA